MDRATYLEKKRELHDAKMASFDKSHDIHQQMRENYRLKMANLGDEAASAELDVKYGELRERLAKQDEEREELDRQMVELDSEVADGFDYVRPERGRVSRALNRFLPSVPESTKEVEKPSELPPRTRSITKLSGIAMAVVVSVVVLLSLEMALWLFKAGPLFMFFAPEEAQALSDKGVGFIAALCLLVSIMAVGSFFSWPSYLLGETCSRQCRYMLGAESWSWGGRLRALCAYAAMSPASYVVPLLAVPLRFVSGSLAMTIYLYCTKKGDSPAVAITASAQYSDSVGRLLTGLAGIFLYVNSFALLLA